MDFITAVKAMKQGKKVRRKAQYLGLYYQLKEDNEFIKYNKHKDDTDEVLDLRDIEATDWEIYEEEDNWNLADNLVYNVNRMGCKIAFKTFIQKVKEDIQKFGVVSSIELSFRDELFEIIDKRAGDL